MQIKKTVLAVLPIDLLKSIRSMPRRITGALAHRNFRFLWFGAFTSSIGTWMQKVAQAWLIVTLTGRRSSFFLGLDAFLGELPLLLFTMIGGVIADRHDRRQLILMSQIVQMFVALVLAGLIHTRQVRIAHVLVLSSIVGCVRAFGGPAYQSLIPTLVSKEHLPNAIALNSIQFNLAQVLGPFVAGVTLAAASIVACFVLNSFSFLFVIAAIFSLRDIHVPPVTTKNMAVQLRDGLRLVGCSPDLVVVMALAFSAAFFGSPLLTFLPIFTNDVFHRDVRFYTQLMAFSGVGAVMGALIIAWLGKHRHMGRILLILLVLCGGIIFGFGLSRGTYLPELILFTGGALFVMCSSLTTSLAQLLAPPQFGGRVLSIYLFAFLGGAPLGGLVSGWFVTRTGSAPLMLLANGTALMLVALCFLIRGEDIKDGALEAAKMS